MRPASRQEPPAVFLLLGSEDDADVDNSALLLFAGEEYLWILAEECGDGKLGAEVVLGPSSRVVGDKAFCHQ